VKVRAGLAGVQLYRRVDYENVIDTARWRELQLARLDSDREYRHELYIEQRATLWSPVDDQKTTVHPAADRIVDMLCGDGGSLVMVLGAAGTGKTFLLREVARRMTERQSSSCVAWSGPSMSFSSFLGSLRAARFP
jgi:Cdc6-like AAA superfamily ATPase